MRPSNKSRSRNKSGNNPNRRNVGNIVNRVFESAGPDGKVRGTPQQIIDKYQALARDAQVSGDRVAAENYLQHAEYYTRLLGEAQRQMQESRPFGERDDRDDGQPRPDGGDRGDRPQQQHHQPRRDPGEPSGLTTIGSDDAEEAGPVETPEEVARRRTETAQREAPEPAMNGGHRPEPAPAGAGGGEAAQDAPAADAPAAKRPRTRRKAKPVDQPAEASAE